MMSKEDLSRYIHARQRNINVLTQKRLKNIDKKRPAFFKLKKHADKFIESEDEYYDRFIMMPGLRGIGKTTMLYQLREYLINEKNIPANNILYLDMHNLKEKDDLNTKDVFKLYLEDFHQTTLVNLDEKVFLFVDEAQLDKNWANCGKTLFDDSFNVFCVFTGSSALNFEVNRDAARRITKESVYPCNFQEYLYLKHDLNLSKNNFKDLILKRDEKSIAKAIECEKIIKKDFINLNNDPEIEMKKFLHSKSFPFALKLDEIDTHLKTIDLVERIVDYDLKDFATFNKDTEEQIMRIIGYLATKKPGSTSSSAIAQSLQMSVKTVNTILESLEKAKLIFSINAYGSAGKMLKKPAQHFFATPSIKASLNFDIGRYDLNHEKCFAALVENMVASQLLSISENAVKSNGLFYDGVKKGVDFLYKDFDTVIPIEVGVGKKTKSQLTRSMYRYRANYAILVSNRTKNIQYDNGILYIPVTTFALM